MADMRAIVTPSIPVSSTDALQAAEAVARAWRIPMRPLKIGVGVVLVFAGGYGIFSEQQSVTSTNAIVSAYVMSVRTPIDGVVSGLPAVGVRISSGEPIGRVDNLRADMEHLQDLRAVEAQAQSGADAVEVERGLLEAQRQRLLARAGAHSEAVAARLEQQIVQAGRLLAARQAAVRQAVADLERGHQLHLAGILADAEFEKLQTVRDVAVQEEAAQEADIATLRLEAASARKGLLSEPGVNNDVAYSRQRADEVNLLLAESNRARTAFQEQASVAHANVDSETQRTELLRKAELVSPLTGLLWRLDAVSGERVATGDSVAELVDCRDSFVLAEVSQDRVPDIAVGGQARFRLSGEMEERTGTVLGVSGDPQKDDNRKLAAFPIQDTSERLATVRIGLAAREARLTARDSQDSCLVGRTARVLLPTNGSNLISHWYRRYF